MCGPLIVAMLCGAVIMIRGAGLCPPTEEHGRPLFPVSSVPKAVQAIQGPCIPLTSTERLVQAWRTWRGPGLGSIEICPLCGLMPPRRAATATLLSLAGQRCTLPISRSGSALHTRLVRTSMAHSLVSVVLGLRFVSFVRTPPTARRRWLPAVSFSAATRHWSHFE